MSSGNESLEREGCSVVRSRGCAELGWGKGACSKGGQCLASSHVTPGNLLPQGGPGFHICDVGLGRSCDEMLRKYFPQVSYPEHLFLLKFRLFS